MGDARLDPDYNTYKDEYKAHLQDPSKAAPDKTVAGGKAAEYEKAELEAHKDAYQEHLYDNTKLRPAMKMEADGKKENATYKKAEDEVLEEHKINAFRSSWLHLSWN